MLQGMNTTLETTTTKSVATVTRHDRDPLELWLDELSPRTGREYGSMVRAFLQLHPDPRTVTPLDVHAFATGAGKSGRAPSVSTVNLRLCALRSWFGFLMRMGRAYGFVIPEDPTAAVKRPRRTAPTPKGLDPEQLERLLAAFPDSAAGRRDRAAVVVALMTALRRTELFSLTRGALEQDEQGRWFYSVTVKGGAQVKRELPPPALQALARYWSERGQPLLELAPGQRLLPGASATFYDNLRRACLNAGLEPVGVHALRHSAAKARYRGGSDVLQIQQLLGHKSLDTTSRYLNGLVGTTDDHWQGAARVLGLTGDDR